MGRRSVFDAPMMYCFLARRRRRANPNESAMRRAAELIRLAIDQLNTIDPAWDTFTTEKEVLDIVLQKLDDNIEIEEALRAERAVIQGMN